MWTLHLLLWLSNYSDSANRRRTRNFIEKPMSLPAIIPYPLLIKPTTTRCHLSRGRYQQTGPYSRRFLLHGWSTINGFKWKPEAMDIWIIMPHRLRNLPTSVLWGFQVLFQRKTGMHSIPSFGKAHGSLPYPTWLSPQQEFHSPSINYWHSIYLSTNSHPPYLIANSLPNNVRKRKGMSHQQLTDNPTLWGRPQFCTSLYLGSPSNQTCIKQ